MNRFLLISHWFGGINDLLEHGPFSRLGKEIGPSSPTYSMFKISRLVFLNPGPGRPQHCTFCMSPLSDTPISGPGVSSTFMLLADAFIQSDLPCIQSIQFSFISMCVLMSS